MIVRNHSGDVDINVILIVKVIPKSSRVILDIHKGKQRKAIKLSDISLTNDEKASLIGLHSFTGNDYCKRKQTCWKIMIKNPKFLCIFSELGEHWILQEDIMRSLEEFVCLLYGSRRVKNFDDLRHQLFQKTYQQKNRIIDLSLLSSCQQTPRLHSLRCNFVAKIWKTQTYVLYGNPQLLIMVGLGNVKFSGLKRLSQTILSNCCQRAVMTRILKKQIQKALTILTLSLQEQTLKYKREVV